MCSSDLLKLYIDAEHLLIKAKALERGQQLLYNDLFYSLIPDDQKIYIPMNLLESKRVSGYEHINVELESIGDNYGIIYDSKEKLDAIASALRPYVVPNFILPIMIPSPVMETTMMQPLMPVRMTDIPYTGKGVYVGVLTTEGVDYTNPIYRDSKGNTRIACLWIQEEGGKGSYYSEAQINEALASDTPEQVVPLHRGSSYPSDLLVRLVGSASQPSYGVATDTKFVVCQIQRANAVLQQLFAGTYNESAVLYPDVIMAVGKMVEFAKYNMHPIVIYLPCLMNLGAHDGSNIYDMLLTLYARQQGCTIIMPSGEEGNKGHHHTVINGLNISKDTQLYSMEAGQNLLGVFYAQNLMQLDINLQMRMGDKEYVSLSKRGITRDESTTIYANGLEFDFGNGCWKVIFRIENMPKGEFLIKINCQPSYCAKCDLWIAQQGFNEKVIVRPSDPYITIGSEAMNTDGIIVGNFNYETLVVSGSSGRGYAWNGLVTPSFVTQGYIKDPEGLNTNTVLEGTAIAAGKIGRAHV